MTSITDTPTLKAWKNIDPETHNANLYFRATMEMPLEHAIGMLEDMKLREKWDDGFYGFEQVEDLSTEEEPLKDVIYWKVKMPMFVTDRDFLVKRLKMTDYEGWDVIYCTNSVEHEKKPVDKAYVRGTFDNAFTFLKKNGEDKTDLEILWTIDPKGMIPKMVYNTIANGIPKRAINDLVKGYEKFKDEKFK